MPKFLTEWKAGKIKDPVARLRYLHHKLGPGSLPPVPGRTRWKAVSLLPAMACLFIPGFKASNTGDELLPPPPPNLIANAAVDVFSDVWQVEKTRDVETFSNGLHIDDRYAVSNDPRVPYPVFGPIGTQSGLRTQPAGIVYHTTESDQASFEENQNGALKKIGKEVLSFVKRNHCYHFLIDRFGQVFRIVDESDIAFHAGNSVWADSGAIYVNLNTSFLGVAFETQTQPGDLPSANPAQIHAARVLTEMLRAKYHIQESNCVTHAQVSVNPDNMLVGYHTDWAGNFPFLEVGLTDNYTAPPASIYALGFDYNPVFVHRTGVRLWQGLALAEDQLRTQSTAQGLRLAQYRAILRKRYKEIITTLKAASAKEERHAT
ncbi:MAG: peptidoglycan recognition family protein [Bryobacteraceae bacterium]